ncbi:trypsin-like peptidase domain-containing protein [Paenibacillus hemerocallicola]|uniref:Trypsin-like peptidase domain-containing protein n=1 Tax=Paenibacillus hemerocallicola TaxID=1172614 RepID=A0A5C4TDS4_9BACL|nr:serine protease [Paenibacillus hemerocallicola]TNJ67244.1 trypsin-like peptidase domain-containing protein [Paenibacillus hemerocallicola]
MSDREHGPAEENEKEEGRKREEELWEEENLLHVSEADEEEDRAYFEKKARTRRRLRKAIAVFLIAALLVNGFAFWPLIYNMQAFRFLAISRELSRNEAVSQYKEAVVVVATEDGKGTGFLLSPDGYIVTNHHVVEGKKKAFVRFADGARHEADVLISEPSLDLAVLKLPQQEQERAALPLERERSWQPGMHVYVIGNPLFFNHIANEGTILGEIPVQGLEVPAMAIQAPIYKGNSGSPVINERGEAIAVVFATAEIERSGEKQMVGLAVPVSHLLPLLDKLEGGTGK